jgi:ABC-type multidrug transport system ATPase subunit
MFELFGLKQDYGVRCVLDIPSLTLQKDGHYALIGANGAGKTTLLRLLMSQLRVGMESSELGYLPQKPYAFTLSVSQNIELGIPSALELNRVQKQTLVERQLADFGLEAQAHQRADRLSGGESQKMALARLLVVPRQILLLDEPTSSMDMNSLLLTNHALINYLRHNLCLLVLISHQQSLIRQLTEELLFLDQGVLVTRGPTNRLLDQPDNELLRRFLHLHLDDLP